MNSLATRHIEKEAAVNVSGDCYRSAGYRDGSAYNRLSLIIHYNATTFNITGAATAVAHKSQTMLAKRRSLFNIMMTC